MKKSPVLGAVCALALTGMSHSASAAIIYNQTLTGAQLFSSGDVSFPNSPGNTSTPTVNGSSLDFINTTNGENSVLMRWDLLLSASRGDLTFNIEVDYSNPGSTVDNDIIFGIQAGSNFLGIQRSDTGDAFAATGPINTTVVPDQDSNISSGLILNGLGSLDPMSWDMVIPDAGPGGMTISNFSEGGQLQNGFAMFSTNLLDADDALSFVLAGNWFNGGGGIEEYRVNSVSITIDDASVVPVPAAVWLFGSGLIGLIGVARRKKA